MSDVRPTAPPFDPHPFGCPLGVRATPADMANLVIALCVKVSDLLHASIYVINPSKGQSYPVLFLSAGPSDPTPRVALFPAWEDEKRQRRVDYARQITLLQRIVEAGVPGESLESYTSAAPERASGSGRGAPPLLLPLAASVPESTPLFRDLHERLGDVLRMTVTRIPVAQGRPELPVVRCYAPDNDARARLVWFPGWATPGDMDLIDVRRMELLLQRAEQRTVPEEPAEVLFGT